MAGAFSRLGKDAVRLGSIMMICRRFRLSLVALCALFFPVLAHAQSYPPAWNSSASYAIGDQVQINGNVLRAIKAVAPGTFKYSSWELWQVRASSTYLVGIGQTFTSIRTAWTFIQNARIADGAYLHLYLSSAHGGYSEMLTSAFSLDHAFGAKISLIGDNPSDTFIFNGNGSDGLTIDSGHALAAVTNIGLTGTFNAAVAIHASANSCIQSVSGVNVAGFNRGVEADTGAYLNCAANLTFTNVVAFDFGALENGIIIVGNGFTCNHSVDEAFFATLGGDIQALNPVIQFGSVAGAYAVDGGVMDIVGAHITQCGVGIAADQSSRIIAEASTLSGNTLDLSADHGATIDALGGTYATVFNGNGGLIF
jgi:hypothetical protein